ncbi:unnamed protein product [Paramecium sonneborni]|uniref:Transmembrane protein n=1 Tax=Paramecium sonneborni TaxID=65129 RepID=A0A8S1RJ06_9CILI|nr:unnamed protein product [Paramecium sonneborni]
MNKQFTTTLSRLVERLFLPSLIFTNFLKAVTISSLVQLIPSTITKFNAYFLIIEKELLVINIGLKKKAKFNRYFTTCKSTHDKYLTTIILQKNELKLVSNIIIQTEIVNALTWSIGKRILEQHENDQNQVEIELSYLRIALPEQQQEIKMNKNQKCLFGICFQYLYQHHYVFQLFFQFKMTQQMIHFCIVLYSYLYKQFQKQTTPSDLMILGSNLYLIYFNNSSQQEKISTIIQIVANRLISLLFNGINYYFIIRQIINNE